jgi:hypothetical protein
MTLRVVRVPALRFAGVSDSAGVLSTRLIINGNHTNESSYNDNRQVPA